MLFCRFLEYQKTKKPYLLRSDLRRLLNLEGMLIFLDSNSFQVPSLECIKKEKMGQVGGTDVRRGLPAAGWRPADRGGFQRCLVVWRTPGKAHLEASSPCGQNGSKLEPASKSVMLRELVVISVRLYIWGRGGLLREDSVSLDSAGAPVRGDPCGPVLLAWRAQCLLQDVAGPAATWAVVCVMQVSTGRHGSGLLARLCCSAACKSDTSVGTRWSYMRVG